MPQSIREAQPPEYFVAKINIFGVDLKKYIIILKHSFSIVRKEVKTNWWLINRNKGM